MSTHFSSARGFARATPRLPQPLTPESLNGLMRERAYWDATHPRFPTYQRLVKRGFEILYPGPERRDDTGTIIDVKPLPPERIKHLVAQTNREMEAMDGGYGGKSDGAVHVQAHSRDGGKTEVSDYWRAAPGHGGGEQARADKSAPATPEVRNLLDEPENARNEADGEGTQTGTDDDHPNPVNPLPDLLKIEIRKDEQGDGRFGTKRTRPDGTTYPHEGVDIKAPPGTSVTSPVDGTIKQVTDAYKSGPLVGQFQAITITGDDNQEYKFLYVTPKDGDGSILVNNKDRVGAGDPIGVVQDRAAQDKSGKMENHVHIEIRDQSGKVVDPTSQIKKWRK